MWIDILWEHSLSIVLLNEDFSIPLPLFTGGFDGLVVTSRTYQLLRTPLSPNRESLSVGVYPDHFCL